MTRQEVLQMAKPILFNTEMVKAILEGRKTVTRRCIKYKYSNTEMKMRTDKHGTYLIEIQKNVEGETFGYNKDGTSWQRLLAFIEKVPPFKKGDILYIRETWQYIDFAGDNNGYVYKASENGNLWETETEGWTWRPSIHMPKEAARIFLKVTGVRVERLQDMAEDDAFAEGVSPWDDRCYNRNGWKPTFCDPDSGGNCCPLHAFEDIWNSTIKKSDMDKYSWNANHWVWVIEFERLEVEE